MAEVIPGRQRWALVRTVSWIVVAAACGDDVTEPLTELRIESVDQTPFAKGEEVTIHGPGVGHATAYIDGTAAERVAARNGVLTVRAPTALPRCTAPLPIVWLKVEAGAFRDSITVSTYGTQIPIDLDVGEHIVIDAVRAGCEVQLARAGTYGVAVYRSAQGTVADEERSRRIGFTVSLASGTSLATGMDAAHMASVAESVEPEAGTLSLTDPLWHVAAPSHAMTRELAAAQRDTVCVKSPSAIGDRIPLMRPFHKDTILYEIASTSPHIAVLVEPDSMTPARRGFVATFAAELERRVLPFLLRAFDGWPDLDGDGRLNVLIGREVSASYSGGIGLNLDGCIGDFIRIGHRYIDDPADPLNNPWETVAHEAAHWYDFGPDLSRQINVADWSREGYASLVARLWRWEDEGRSPWANAPLECPPSATCYIDLLLEKRYGLPGLSLENGYSHGLNIMQYLLYQSVAPGGPVAGNLAPMRNRAVGPNRVDLLPIFLAAGGTGRTEAELQGEYLLAHYADDHIPGVSPRLMVPGRDLSRSGPGYPMFHFRLDAGTPAGRVDLARPDGVVVEVVAGDAETLSITPGRSDLAISIVRGR